MSQDCGRGRCAHLQHDRKLGPRFVEAARLVREWDGKTDLLAEVNAALRGEKGER